MYYQIKNFNIDRSVIGLVQVSLSFISRLREKVLQGNGEGNGEGERRVQVSLSFNSRLR